jgi:hypothetical protein
MSASLWDDNLGECLGPQAQTKERARIVPQISLAEQALDLRYEYRA